MPQSIEPFTFGFENKDNNILKAKEYLADGKLKELENIDWTYKFYELSNGYCLIDFTRQFYPKVLYSVEYKLHYHEYLKRTCAQQIAVWRNPKFSITKGLAENIFFNALISSYHTIISDSMQTPDGQRFWDIRISEAFDKGLMVYYTNLKTPNEIIQVNNSYEYEEIVIDKNIWGNIPKFQSRRMIITDTKIIKDDNAKTKI